MFSVFGVDGQWLVEDSLGNQQTIYGKLPIRTVYSATLIVDLLTMEFVKNRYSPPGGIYVPPIIIEPVKLDEDLFIL